MKYDKGMKTKLLKTKKVTVGLRRAAAFALTLTLAAPGFTPAGSVQASQGEEPDTEDKQYIVYIDLPDEADEYDADDVGETSGGSAGETADTGADVQQEEENPDSDAPQADDGTMTGQDRETVSSNAADLDGEQGEEEQGSDELSDFGEAAQGAAAETDNEEGSDVAEREADEALWQEIEEAQQLLEESSEVRSLPKMTVRLSMRRI